MRVVIQRVTEASVKVDHKIIGAIHGGLLIFLGICDEDTNDDISWLVNKLLNLRIFNDDKGVMNLSLKDTDGEALVISQFTLMASTKKGNRPSYLKASKPALAIPLYEAFILQLEKGLGKKVGSGIFGADMKISLLNDGPVTIVIDSMHKE